MLDCASNKKRIAEFVTRSAFVRGGAVIHPDAIIPRNLSGQRCRTALPGRPLSKNRVAAFAGAVRQRERGEALNRRLADQVLKTVCTKTCARVTPLAS